MYCLACGDCCNRMSPLTHGKCPHVIEIQPTVFICGDYEHRPEECVNHTFPARVCPIGVNVLGITESEEYRKRVDLAYECQKKGKLK